MMTMKNNLENGQLYEGTVVDCTENGSGVLKIEGMTVFAQGALPGDQVRVRINEIKKNYAIAKLDTCLVPSGNRRKPQCAHVSTCGGCSVQEFAYEAQLKLKQNRVENVLKRIGKIDAKVQPIIGMEEPWAYRNKAYFQMSVSPKGRIDIGFNQHSSHRIVDVTACQIVQPDIQKVANVTRERLNALYNQEPDAMKAFKGLMVRQSSAGKLMIVICTEGKASRGVKQLAYALSDCYEGAFGDNLASFYLNEGKAGSKQQMGFENTLISGEKVLEDTLFDLNVSLSPLSFTQVNPTQTVALYNAIRACMPKSVDTLLDLYCGIGSIGLSVGRDVKHLIGVERIASAVSDATENAKRNGFTNARFITGLAEVVLPELIEEGIVADVAIVDPPRKGCEKSLIDTLLRVQPKHIIYVSCDPSTLARDLSLLSEGYRAERVQPVDLFPHSMNVECVVLLSRVAK